MSARGVHFALDTEQYACVLEATDDVQLMALIEAIEQAWDRDFLAESDKAWDAIHRCLTDGSLLYESGEYPLNHVICGGRQLHQGDEYTMSLVTPEQVKAVAAAVVTIDKAWLRHRYYSVLKADEYDGEVGEEDFDYTWIWFENVRRLFQSAAANQRAVLFTVAA